MRIRLSHPALSGDLVEHFRRFEYVAHAEDGAVAVSPMNAVSERFDRSRVALALSAWQAHHPGVLATLEDD